MKTTVDFHLIGAMNTEQIFHAACQLTEQAYRQQHTVYLYAESEDSLKVLDNLLWSFRDDSFLPHQLWLGETSETASVLLGCPESPLPPAADVLINLVTTVPNFYAQFSKVLELIPEEPVARQLARERYRYYKSQGCELVTR
ncbi:MAG TPA: DNA polymerase III subunit chi [Gammaproteobacteria bacterium]|nr:DNA polymerase III subunit chi [Gammaproteobacteria bacterium]